MILIFIMALIASLAVVALASRHHPRLHHRQNAMADAALAAIYSRYQREVREFTHAYMRHAPPEDQWLAEIEAGLQMREGPKASRPYVILRRRWLIYIVNFTAPPLIAIGGAVLGLLAAAISHRGAWWGLLIPAWGLVDVLTRYKWQPPRYLTLLTGRRAFQAVSGSALIGLLSAAVISGGMWWTLVFPGSGLFLLAILPMHNSQSSHLLTLLTGRWAFQGVIGSALIGLLSAAVISGGVWRTLLIPIAGLLLALITFGDWPRFSPALLITRRPVQGVIGAALIGLVTGAVISEGVWYALLIPAYGLTLTLIRHSRRSAAGPDERIKMSDHLVSSGS
jgi:hypothetical protein